MKATLLVLGLVTTSCAHQIYQRQTVRLEGPKAVLVKAVEYVR